MTIWEADPAKLWNRVEKAFLAWEKRWSPARWSPWRDVFWDREGFYVLLRCGLLLGALIAVSMTQWGTLLGTSFRLLAIIFTLLFLIEIVIVHASIVFVSMQPANSLRSAVLAIFSFFQIPIGFAVFYMCAPTSFNPVLVWDNALYFSFVTATTLGYGDIQPTSRLAKFIVIGELITSITFLSVLVARLISLAKK